MEFLKSFHNIFLTSDSLAIFNRIKAITKKKNLHNIFLEAFWKKLSVAMIFKKINEQNAMDKFVKSSLNVAYFN